MLKEQKQKKTFWEIIAKYQKLIIITCLLSFVLILVYALIFYTPFNDLYASSDSVWASAGKTKYWTPYGIDYTTLPEECWVYNDSNTRVIGLNMTYFVRCLGDFSKYGNETIQSFNHLIFKIGIIGILVSCLLFIYRSQIRKNYYVTNYVVHGIWSVFAVSISITLFVLLSQWQTTVNDINIDIINKFREFKELTAFSLDSLQWIFVVGYVICIILILSAVLLNLLSVSKYLITKKNKELKLAQKELSAERV